LIESNEIRAGYALAEHQAATAAGPTVTTSTPVAKPDGSIIFQVTVKPAAAPQPTPTPTPTPTPSPPIKKFVDVSRLLHYYATRKIEGTTGEDAGATIRDTIKAGVTYGMADEKLWPYDISKFAVNPPSGVWTEAAKHKVVSYHSIADGDIETMKTTLLTGQLVEFGFAVYDYMLSAQMAANGILPRPVSGETEQGGHAVALVGFDDNMAMPDGSKGAFLVRNSWGTGWGIAGYFWMAYNYVGDANLASDFWVVVSSTL
jgi:C1A family cysteine protease